MKEVKSKIKLEIPDFEEVKHFFNSEFDGYKIKYNAFSDLWHIRNSKFKHTVFLNESKESKLISKYVRAFKQEVGIQLGILFLAALAHYFFRDFFEDTILFVLAFLTVLETLNWIYHKNNPKYRDMLDTEHIEILRRLKKHLNIKKEEI